MDAETQEQISIEEKAVETNRISLTDTEIQMSETEDPTIFEDKLVETTTVMLTETVT